MDGWRIDVTAIGIMERVNLFNNKIDYIETVVTDNKNN